MELRHLSYFAACAETGSMSRAATRLAITQPSLSRQVRNLERELGTQLLRRSSRGVTTTAAGERLLRHYRRVSADIARIPDVMAAAAAERETVRVGMPPSLPTSWFTEVIGDLREHHPHIDLDLVDLFTPEQERALKEGRLDVGILHHDAGGLVTREVLRQQLGVAVRPELASEVRSLADMHGRRVLGHESWENSGQWRDLVAAAAAVSAAVDWRFRRFSEHVELVAHAARADGLLVTRDTAQRFVPSWPWVAISTGALELTSWVAYSSGASEATLAVAAAISARPYEKPVP
ncbi:LysR family transcriptional regulator [Georgenia sp. Z1491]|uniref:LysR family transcriptional regulator n=1 Tax=Georgenia sp. Z1491 TaxID=3416707 RepID=UPI003CF18CCD